MFKKYRRMMSEMSRASTKVLGQNSDENIIYYTDEFLKINARKGKKPTSMAFKKFMEEQGFDYDHVARVLGISNYVSKSHMDTSFFDKLQDRFDAINAKVESGKDDIDYMLDTFWEYYDKKTNSEDTSDIENTGEFKAMVNLMKNDPETAKMEFGKHYDKIKRHLAKFISDNYESTDEYALEAFWDWYRDKKNGSDAELDDEVADRILEILEDPDGKERVGGDSSFYALLNTFKKYVGTLEGGEHAKLQRELRRIMKALDNPEYIDKVEAEENRRAESGLDDNARDYDESDPLAAPMSISSIKIPAAVLRKIVSVANEPGSIDKTKVGKVDKAQVRDCYLYCMNILNRKYHVGKNGAFDGTLQEFYDKFKIVFVRGYKLNILHKIFDEVVAFMLNELDKDAAKYWNTVEDRNIDDEDFNESVKIRKAKRILREHGYRVV